MTGPLRTIASTALRRTAARAAIGLLCGVALLGFPTIHDWSALWIVGMRLASLGSLGILESAKSAGPAEGPDRTQSR